MQQVSAAFHTAVRDGSAQRVSIRFLADDLTLTGANITDGGLTVTDSFNEGDDLAIGQCVANEAHLTVYNDDGHLDDYAYGEAEISIGVLTEDGWEDCPLGIFDLQAPRRRSIRVELSGCDRMLRFDRDVSAWWSGITYPITLGTLLASLCTEVGVPWTPVSFINSTLTLTAAPLGASGLTGRDVLKWICQAACCYGRISRAGALELRWWQSSGQTIPRRGRNNLVVAEYRVPQIDRVHIITAESDLGVLVPETGTDLCEYQIIDNPFLYGSTEAAIRALGQPIYTRLAAVPEYLPMEVDTAAGDWSLEAGDTAAVELTPPTEPVYTASDPQYRYHGVGYREDPRVSGEASRFEWYSMAGPMAPPLSASHITEPLRGCWFYVNDTLYHADADAEIGEDASGYYIYATAAEPPSETLYIFRQEIRWRGGCSIHYTAAGQPSRLVANSATRRLFDQSWRYFKLKADIEGLAIEIGGKIDGTQCQTLIDASMSGIAMSVTSGSTGSSFSMTYNGVQISTQTLDLHVKSVNVDGTITADAINLNTATITGTLSAGNIDATNLDLSNASIGTLQVDNANINTLYASKIVGGSIGGYISAGAISDAINALSSLNVGDLSLASGGGNAGTITMSGANYVILGNAGVKLSAKGSYTSWADIVSGATGGAVFG